MAGGFATLLIGGAGPVQFIARYCCFYLLLADILLTNWGLVILNTSRGGALLGWAKTWVAGNGGVLTPGA